MVTNQNFEIDLDLLNIECFLQKVSLKNLFFTH